MYACARRQPGGCAPMPARAQMGREKERDRRARDLLDLGYGSRGEHEGEQLINFLSRKASALS